MADTNPSRQPGRWTAQAKSGEKTTLSLRVAPSTKRRLDESGKDEGRNLSQEAERRIDATFQDEDAFDRALTLSYGSDNGPLLHLIGEVLRVVSPYGAEWVDEDAAAQNVAVGLVHLLKRLRTPDNGVITDEGVEKRVDGLLFELGYDGSEWRHGETSPRARWAAEKRRRFGIFGPRLVRYRKAARKLLEEGPVREPPEPEQSARESWNRIIDGINARRASRGEGA